MPWRRRNPSISAEQAADVGNGNYGYIDSLKEAKRLLVDQLAATIQIIVKDVKVQVEFNPAVVAEYRLIGYKAPDGRAAKLIETRLATARLDKPESTDAELDFAAAVAAFGQKLRGGDYLKNYSYDQIAELARAARGSDEEGMRAEFIGLVELAKALGGSGSVQWSSACQPGTRDLPPCHSQSLEPGETRRTVSPPVTV